MPIDSDDGLNYWEDMTFAVEYALANRKKMLEIILTEVLQLSDGDYKASMETLINESHNFAEKRPDGILHRKGATPAYKGQPGIIPANMKDGVFLTVGLGNEEYLSSASHGAGRKMSRKKARKAISQKEFEEVMKGIVARTGKKIIDEAPMAYKDISQVIKMQEGKVIKVTDKLVPLINIKG